MKVSIFYGHPLNIFSQCKTPKTINHRRDHYTRKLNESNVATLATELHCCLWIQKWPLCSWLQWHTYSFQWRKKLWTVIFLLESLESSSAYPQGRWWICLLSSTYQAAKSSLKMQALSVLFRQKRINCPRKHCSYRYNRTLYSCTSVSISISKFIFAQK